MNRRYLVHVVAAWRLVRLARSSAVRAIDSLLAHGAVHCVDALDGSPPPQGMQLLEPTLEELALSVSHRRGLGPADRVMLAVGATRRLVCVSDEPSLARASCAFGVELIGVSRFLGECLASESVVEFERVSLQPAARRASTGGAEASTVDASPPAASASASLAAESTGRVRHATVRTRRRQEPEQLERPIRGEGRDLAAASPSSRAKR